MKAHLAPSFPFQSCKLCLDSLFFFRRHLAHQSLINLLKRFQSERQQSERLRAKNGIKSDEPAEPQLPLQLDQRWILLVRDSSPSEALSVLESRSEEIGGLGFAIERIRSSTAGMSKRWC
jgi:hypothetical protein